MNVKLGMMILCGLAVSLAPMAAHAAAWWNPKWRFRTTVIRPTPYRDAAPRPVEAAVDFSLLLERAGISGRFDPASVRVVERGDDGKGREVPSACRTEVDAETGRECTYVAWIAHPKPGEGGTADIYFDTKDRRVKARTRNPKLVPPENLLANPGFENIAGSLPAGWNISSTSLVRLGKFKHTTGRRSLKIGVDEKTPKGAGREVTIAQKIDVRQFAGREMVFECDLLAERAAWGAPVSIELQQFREDGSRIPECAVQPRWLAIELAAGQLVQFRERGRFSHEAASVNVRVRVRCYARDADTQQTIAGPESFSTVWLDRMVVRPGERWPWPAATNGGFVKGALKSAPFNRGFEFTGQRRIVFNGGSEGTLTANKYGDAKSVHWGLQAGTVEFWCRPSWNADDGAEHIFFDTEAYGHRRQCRLRKLASSGGNQLEFSIADAGGKMRSVRGRGALRAGRWHHVAATWDFPKAHVQLFVDGKGVGSQGPGKDPWPSSLVAEDKKKKKGIGIGDEDRRSMPMQAFIGGDNQCRKAHGAEAVLDEFRVSDIARYSGDFTPPRNELDIDEHTRVLFHFENECDGVHDSDDRFVRGHLSCELPRQEEKATLEILRNGRKQRRSVLVKPHASAELFETNRAENRLTATRPFRELPDPRFIEYRERQVERTVGGARDEFVLKVGGDFEPLMRSVTFQHAKRSPPKTTPLSRWRANDNVVPFSAESIAATLAPEAAGDAEKAFEAFKYALQVTNYYDAHYCETLPSGRHRPRVSYTLTKALNVYPFDQCGPLNHMLRKLFLAAGVSSNNASGTHHQFEQAFYKGSWRLFDLSSRIYWLNWDNTTLASRRELEKDLYLKLRQGGKINAYIRGRKSRATFGSAERPHDMVFTLRPGERAGICWHNEGRWFEVTGDRKPIPLAKIPPYFGNGAIVYEPTPQGEASVWENMAVNVRGKGICVLRAKNPARAASLIYRAQCPYIFSDAQVSGSYAAAKAGAVSLSVSFDKGKKWKEVWRSGDKKGEIAANMREQVTGHYAYWLKLELAAGRATTVTGLKVRTTLVASPLALPGKLSRGENRIQFVGGQPAVPVSTTCRWVERHKSKLGVSLNAVSYYMNGDEAFRNLFVVAPGASLPVIVSLGGRRLSAKVSLERLPAGWEAQPAKRSVRVGGGRPAAAEFVVNPGETKEGEIQAFDVVVRDGKRERHVSAQVLVAGAALVTEAERADEATGKVATADLPEASGAKVMTFTGRGRISFDLKAPREGTYALWLRARWKEGSSTRMTLEVDNANSRSIRAAGLIGFHDWTRRTSAYTKTFAHFGKHHEHWAWYRVSGIQLTAGKHRLSLAANPGAFFDSLVLLPQNPVMDRAAMNLFHNWNYAPWQNPL